MPHISIKTKLNLKEGVRTFNSINIDTLNIKIDGELVYGPKISILIFSYKITDNKLIGGNTMLMYLLDIDM